MTTNHIRIISSLTLLLGATVNLAAYAFDTDVYTKSQYVGPTDQPNVLIILDNSGSMNDTVPNTRPGYDSSIDYCTDDLDTKLSMSGANANKPSNCGNIAGRIYFSFTGSPPSYSSSSWFAASKNKCFDSTSALSDAGRYSSSKIASWLNNKNWRTLNSLADSDITYVDCEADKTANGSTVGDNQFPQNSKSTAYTNVAKNAFNWSNYSSNAFPTLYNANYMNYASNTKLQTDRTRIEVAKDAVNELINSNKSIRFGLMIFNSNSSSDSTSSSTDKHGGRLIFKIDDMTDARRASMVSVVNSIVASTNTPLAETMWEAYNYLSGSAVYYGKHDSSATPGRDTSAESGANYITPLKFSCQNAYIVLVTDGDPTSDTNANSKIKTKTGDSTCDASGASCLTALTKYMYKNDIVGSLPEMQRAVTYTIGFGGGISASGLALLQAAAQNAGGTYYTADDADQLNSSLQKIVVTLLEQTSSITAPSLAINAFNKQYNNDDVYLSVFFPVESCAWQGNVKKYKLCTNADITAGRCSDLSQTLDMNGALITDVNNNIVDTARSYWSAAADGSNVDQGGAGVNIPAPASRNIYTYYGAYSGLSSPSAGVKVEINGSNAFYTAVTGDPTKLGLPSTATSTDVNNVINWMRGYVYGSSTTTRWAFADPLHSRAVPITFGGTSASPITKLFVGANDGTLRMINNSTGIEEWAFVPQEMYDRQYNLSQAADGEHIFGMDNTPNFWIKDLNGDGIIDYAAGDRVYMYVAMRRGGNHIYAFDVTPPTKLTTQTATFTPKLVWVIEGGSGDFAKLGQTWSVPQIVRVPYKCSGTLCADGTPGADHTKSRVVLMFAGGYDPHQDNTVPAGTDSIGNAIYMVDPLTGTRIWWASNSGATLNLTQMKYGIPSDLLIIDSNGDGMKDRVYVGDTGGQVWRIDLGTQLEVNANGGTAGYVFADIGCTGGSRSNDCSATTAQHSRKFFYVPEVAPIRDMLYSTVPSYDAVAIGSGDREDPLDLLTDGLPSPQSKEAAHNRIYLFRDYNYITGKPTSTPAALSEADLYDSTQDGLDTLTGTNLATEVATLKGKTGWYIDLIGSSAVALPNGLTTQWVGEKVMAKATVLDGVLYVTTFTPANSNNAALTCGANAGLATEYVFDLASSKAALKKDGSTVRSAMIGSGIPSEVVIVFRPDGTSGLISGGGKGGAPVKAGGISTNSAERHYWTEE